MRPARLLGLPPAIVGATLAGFALLVAALALTLAMMAIAFRGAALLGCVRPQRVALSLECGLQNGTLAIAVVAALGLDAAHAVPAAIYSLLMFGTAPGFVAAGRPG